MYLNGAVVLVDLNAELAAGGEVVRLGQVSLQTMVLHSVNVVIHAYKSFFYYMIFIIFGRQAKKSSILISVAPHRQLKIDNRFRDFLELISLLV